MAFASHADSRPYHGWVMSYDATTLAQTSIINMSPASAGAGIWQAGTGLTSDDQGNVFAVTGNGFDTNPLVRSERTESVIRFSLDAGSLSLADWFTPFDYATLDENDNDLGCDGPMLVPGTQYVVTGAKSGKIYVLDRGNLGGLAGNDVQIPQEFQAVHSEGTEHIHGTPTYWNSRLYVWGENDYGRAYAFDGTTFNPTFVDQTTMQAPQASMPGGILSVSADGSTPGTGIVWANLVLSGDANQATRPGILRAFDAGNLSNELWDSQQDALRDNFGNFAKFVPPVVSNGKVYLGTFSNQIMVYGLLAQ